MSIPHHRVYRSMNKPLTILGAERRLFFVAISIAAALWNYFGAFPVSVILFLVLHAAACWVTQTDLQLIRIVMNSGRHSRRYDPAKWPDLQMRGGSRNVVP